MNKKNTNKVLFITGIIAGILAIIAGVSAITLSIIKQGVYPDWVNTTFLIAGIINILLGFMLAAIVRT